VLPSLTAQVRLCARLGSDAAQVSEAADPREAWAGGLLALAVGLDVVKTELPATRQRRCTVRCKCFELSTGEITIRA